MPENSPQPISEDDRYTAAKLLKEALAKGQISDEERDERLRRVLAAGTHGELLQALTSLPAEPTDSASTIAVVSGRVRRRGAWRVPRVLRVESAFGRVHLNLARAVIEYPEIDIQLQLGTGKARITVPRNAVVDVDGLSTGWHGPAYVPQRRPGHDGPTIRIRGHAGLGRVRIRHAWW
jgi:hypothetical protein